MTLLTVQPANLADVLHMLQRAADRADTTAGAATVDEVCAGSIPFVVASDGVPVMAYTIARHGRTCWVQAAAGSAQGVDLTKTIMPHIEKQARALGAEQVAVTTRRRGLVRKLEGMGYAESGVTLRKAL